LITPLSPSGAGSAVGGVVSTVTVTAGEAALSWPAWSTCLTTSVWTPSVRLEAALMVADHVPSSLLCPWPIRLAPS
jgi:hypothetical protein